MPLKECILPLVPVMSSYDSFSITKLCQRRRLWAWKGTSVEIWGLWKKGAWLFLPDACRRAPSCTHLPYVFPVFFFFLTQGAFLLPIAMLRYGLLGYMLYTCPNLWQRSCSQCYAMDCFGTCFTHAQSCDIAFVFTVLRYGLLRYMLYTCPKLWYSVRVHTATLWIASVHALHMPKAVI